jgi:hypothetical protein
MLFRYLKIYIPINESSQPAIFLFFILFLVHRRLLCRWTLVSLEANLEIALPVATFLVELRFQLKYQLCAPALNGPK